MRRTLNPIKVEKRHMTELQEENPNLPKYKARAKEALAWIFTGFIKIDIQPLTLSIKHPNDDFIRRFTQLIKLGTVKHSWEEGDFDTRTWRLTNPKEILFLMQQIESYIHTQSERRISELLIKQCTNPDDEILAKLIPLIKKHNKYFYIEH